MPTKVFDQLDAIASSFTVGADAIVIFGDHGADSAPLSTILIETGAGSWRMDPNLTATSPDTGVSAGISSVVDPALIQTWSINYNRTINPVPDGAHVKKLVFRRPRTINYTANCSGNPIQFNGGLYDALFAPLYFSEFSLSGPSPLIDNESIIGSDADEILFDYTAGPTFITKQELIDNWSDFNNNFALVGISAGSDSATPSSANLAGSLTFGLGWTVTVTYEESYSWIISQDPTIPIDEGSTVTLKSFVNPNNPTGPVVNFESVTQIDILVPDYSVPGTFFTVNVPIGDWTLIAPHLLQFIMINWPVGNPAPTVVKVKLTSTQFSGSVEKQLYTILFASASGIYELVPGKTSDTLYIEEESGETIDVKIPNPNGRTGFFGK